MNLQAPVTFKEFLMQKNTAQLPVKGSKKKQVDATMKNLLGSTDVAPGEGEANMSKRFGNKGSVQ